MSTENFKWQVKRMHAIQYVLRDKTSVSTTTSPPNLQNLLLLLKSTIPHLNFVRYRRTSKVRVRRCVS